MAPRFCARLRSANSAATPIFKAPHCCSRPTRAGTSRARRSWSTAARPSSEPADAKMEAALRGDPVILDGPAMNPRELWIAPCLHRALEVDADAGLRDAWLLRHAVHP